MGTPFETKYRAPPAQHSDFALVLGGVLCSIILTGGILSITRLVLYLIDLR